MIQCSDLTKALYMQDNSHKTVKVVFSQLGLTYYNSNIEQESLKVTESVLDRDEVEFIGCISSCLQITLFNVPDEVKGRKIEVYIKVENEAFIKLFTGVVDSVVIQSDRNFKKITAYDLLYTASQKDVADWYSHLAFPMTIATFRQSLCSYIGLPIVEQELPNDDIVINKEFENAQMPAIDVLKSLCQINGAFGIVNRDGLFELRLIQGDQYPAYPSSPIAYPGLLYPATVGSVEALFNVEFCELLEFEEYRVKPIQRIQIRDSEFDNGVTVGSGKNKYIIQGNMFTYGQSAETKANMARNISRKLGLVSFRPCKIKNYGLPFIECGDVLRYYVRNSDEYYDFVVMDREISGIQLLHDTYTARGNEEQSEFITDIQAQLDAIKRGGVGNLKDYYTKEEIDANFWTADETAFEVAEITDTAIAQMETPTGFNIVSCYSLPSNPQPNTLYCIQGMVIMI